MRNVLKLAFWVLAAHLLLTFSPAAGPVLNKAYGAFPLAGTVFVNATASLPPDGLSCPSGWRTISEGIAHAVAGDTVIVCDSSTYAENVTMKDGVSLVSEVSGSLPSNFTSDDVLIACMMGSTQSPGGLPTIQGNGGAPVVSFSQFKKPTSLKGFHITGGRAAVGGGVSVEGCSNVSVVANCITSNAASGGSPGAAAPAAPVPEPTVLGAGVGIQDATNITLDRNAILSNTSDGVGGGIACIRTSSLICSGNLIEFNQAQQGGGGGFIQNTQDVKDVDGVWAQNQTREGFGGGLNVTSKVRKLTIKNSKFTDCSSDLKGGGGVNIDGVKTADLNNVLFGRCKSSTQNSAPSDFERATGSLSGGGLRVESSRVDMVKVTFDKCTSAVDGGGLLSIGTPSLGGGGALIGASSFAIVSMGGTTFNECVAFEDGGGTSCTLAGQVIMNGQCSVKKCTATGKGGGVHVSCVGKAEISNTTIQDNTAGTNGGGLFVRDGTILLSGAKGKEVVVQNNAATQNGGGLYALVSDNAVQFAFCNFDTVFTSKGTSWIGNKAGASGGAVLVERPKDVHTITFILDGDKLTDNTAKDATEAAVEVHLGNQPMPTNPHSMFQACTFSNPGVQLKGKHVDAVKDFYDVTDCVFNLGVDRVGISLINDAPKIQGQKTVFSSTVQGAGIGIASSSTTPAHSTPEVKDGTFTKLAAGIKYSQTDGVIQGCTFTGNGVAIDLASSSPEISGSTFSGNGQNITQDAQSAPVIKANNKGL